VPEALSDGGLAGREGGTGLRDAGQFFLNIGILFEPPKKKIKYVRVDFFMNTRR
jgi:hypothetical protein